ncbi:MAG: uroporphyrinogen-III synthase [Betaproteobacteria bacterium]
MNRPCVIVTRPRSQATAWVQALVEHGLQAQSLPLIDIAPPPEPVAVQQAWQRLATLDFVMFVSMNAVAHFFALRPPDVRWPAGLRAGSTGPGTTAALRGCGVAQADIAQPALGEPSESEALWRQVADQPWGGRHVLVVRGEDGRNWLAQQFAQAGAEVEFLVAYQRRPPLLDEAATQLLAAAAVDPSGHVWLFSSSEAVSHLRALDPQADWSASRAVATHARIAQAARAAGFTQVLVVEPGLEAVAACCAHLESFGC